MSDKQTECQNKREKSINFSCNKVCLGIVFFGSTQFKELQSLQQMKSFFCASVKLIRVCILFIFSSSYNYFSFHEAI